MKVRHVQLTLPVISLTTDQNKVYAPLRFNHIMLIKSRHERYVELKQEDSWFGLGLYIHRQRRVVPPNLKRKLIFD